MPSQSQSWYHPLIWMDFRLAIIFTVLVPLILLLWAVAQKNEAIQTQLIIYWRVASLLAISVYLAIGSLTISLVAGFVAQILIPISLWFWADINEEIADLSPRPLKLAFTAWRWATSLYCSLSALFVFPFLHCAIGPARTSACQAWLQPSWLYYQFFHANSNPDFLGLFIGGLGLVIYTLYLIYFVVVRLGKQGRSAMVGEE